MLHIRQTKHLLRELDISHAELDEVTKDPDAYYEPLLLSDPQKPDKQRLVLNVTGRMRTLQTRLYRRILLPKLTPSVYSHGCVKRRSIKTNASQHLDSAFVFKTDIRDFYPTIRAQRIYSLFAEKFQCSPSVARICTRISTYNHHLALGLICSPILADQILHKSDKRIGGACESQGLTYTRFVDDIAISGPFNLQRAGIAKLVVRILNEEGFSVNPKKHSFGSLSEVPITALRVVRGHLDVRREYLDELVRQIDDAGRLGRDEEFYGPYYLANQIIGRVRFVCWINPNRRRDLTRRFKSVDWKKVRRIARQRGYEVSRRTLTKLSD